MPQKIALALMLLICFGVLCFAQEQTAASATPVQMKVVKGIPFSAKVATESTQTLADGNRIVRKSEALIARDSEGRTRREQKLAGINASIIFIQDPVAGVSYVLDTKAGSVGEVQLQKFEGVESPVNVREGEPLGNQFIEGFVAEGACLKQNIPAGKAASERPLDITSETWYSPQLQIVLRKRTVDPRIGVVEYMVTEIQLAEPDRLDFEIPKDYAVREMPPLARPLVVESSKDK